MDNILHDINAFCNSTTGNVIFIVLLVVVIFNTMHLHRQLAMAREAARKAEEEYAARASSQQARPWPDPQAE